VLSGPHAKFPPKYTRGKNAAEGGKKSPQYPPGEEAGAEGGKKTLLGFKIGGAGGGKKKESPGREGGPTRN